MPEVIERLPLVRTGRFDARTVEFTAIDVETTGFAPGHVVELAAVRVRADGTVVGELSTLVNPGPGVSPGPTHVHRIRRQELDAAPSFAEVLPYFAELARGSVLVAHNLPFEARFLAQEFQRCALRLTGLPGVCTLAAAREALDGLPNHRLATVAHSLGAAEFAMHTALGDARACAHVVAALVGKHGLRLRARPRFPELPRLAPSAALAPRAEAMPVTTRSWTAELPERIATPVAAATDTALEDAYVELLGDVLADHHLSEDEAVALAGLAKAAGLGEADLRRIHTDFVRGLQAVAESDGILTPDEIAELQAVAAALGVSSLVASLQPVNRTARPTRVLVLGRQAEADEIRSAVLGKGVGLAKNLTASVTHVIVCADADGAERRVQRAKELGAAVLTVAAARAEFGLPGGQRTVEPVTPTIHSGPTTPVPQPVPTRVTRPQPVPGQTAWVQPVPAQVAPRPGWGPPAPEPSPAPAPVPSRQEGAAARSGSRVLVGFGLVLLFLAAISQFGGAPLAAGIVIFVLGLAIIVGGRALAERGGR